MSKHLQPSRGTMVIILLVLALLAGSVAFMMWRVMAGMALATCGAGCSDAPLQPRIAMVPLEVSASTVVEEDGFAEAVGGYLRGVVADMDGDSLRATAGYLATLAEDPDNLALRGRVFESSLLEGDVANALRLARTLPLSEGQAMPALVRALGDAQAGNMALAREELARVTKIAPDLLQFRLLESYLALAQGVPVAEEVARVQALAGPQPLQARKLYHVARMWQRAGNAQAARSALEESNRLEEGALFTTLMLGKIYEDSGEAPKAAELYRVFREKNPQVVLLDDVAMRQAADGYHANSTLQGDMALTLFDFGLLVWAQGAVVPARQLMNLALWLDGSNPYILYYAGIIDEYAGDHATALGRYNTIAESSPVWLAAQVRKAESLFKLDQRRDAMAMMQELARKRPDIPAFRRSLGEMAFDNRNYRLAVREYTALINSQKDLAAQPLVAVMYFARGASYERLGDFDKAAADLSLSLTLNPNNPSVLNYLGYMWADRGENLPEATAMLQRALTLAPDDGAIVDSLGWAYFKQGATDKALAYLEKAADMTPDDATVNSHLGDVYELLGRHAEARRQWQRALELWGEDDEPGLREQLRTKLK